MRPDVTRGLFIALPSESVIERLPAAGEDYQLRVPATTTI